MMEIHKGRGAVSNLQGRFERDRREACEDGWPGGDEGVADARLRTVVTAERARTILTRNASPDVPFNVSLNPYRGCEHGCIYCFARPTHSYLDLSPGLDFETRIFAKTNAAEQLRRELARPGYVPECIALGVATDAYQPAERKLGITRAVLQVLHDCAHPFATITKSSGIERDIDLLAPLAARRIAMAAVTLTTLDAALARTLEPRAATPERRLLTIRRLTEVGIPVAVSVAPLIPFVTEPDLETVLEAAREAGAVRANYVVLRLPWEVAPLFKEWLAAHFPQRAERVMARIRDMRGGKDYDSDFAQRRTGTGLWAQMLARRFEVATRRLGYDRTPFHLDASQFRAPLLAPSERARLRAGRDRDSGELF